MSNSFQGLPSINVLTLATQLSHSSSQQNSYYSHVPDSAPAGMTVDQGQLIWSSVIELFTENELIDILADSMHGAPPMRPIYEDKVSTVESVPERDDAFNPTVFSVLRKVAIRSANVEIDDRGTCIVLNRALWSHMTCHLLSLLVRSGQAPESLNELLLAIEVGV